MRSARPHRRLRRRRAPAASPSSQLPLQLVPPHPLVDWAHHDAAARARVGSCSTQARRIAHQAHARARLATRAIAALAAFESNACAAAPPIRARGSYAAPEGGEVSVGSFVHVNFGWLISGHYKAGTEKSADTTRE